MARRSISERSQELTVKMADIKNQITLLENEEVQRIGKVAKSSGLLELSLSDADLRTEFVAIAARFQGPAKQTDASRTTLP